MVNTETLNQMFLFNIVKHESETTSSSSHSTLKFKSGDIGEFLFNLECAKLDFAPFRPELSNGPIDRLLLLPNGEIKKIHIKTAVLKNVCDSQNKRNNTFYKHFYYSFMTANSDKTADYFFCCGLDESFSKTFIWWIPWSERTHILIPYDGRGFEPYLRCPFEFKNSQLGIQTCP